MYASRAAFIADFTAFATAPEAVVTACLTAAAAQMPDLELWGAAANAHRAHGLLTAHFVSLEPGGQTARLSAENTETTYGRQFDELRTSAACAIRVFG